MKAGAVNESANDIRKPQPLAVSFDPGESVDLQDLLQKLLVERQLEAEQLRARIVELQKQNATTDASRKQSEQALALTRQRLTNVLDQAAELRETNASRQIDLDRLQRELEVATDALAISEKRKDIAESCLREKAVEERLRSKEYSVSKERGRALDMELEALRKANQELEAKLAEVNEWTFKLAGERRAAEEEARKARRALGQQRKTRERAEAELGALSAVVANLKKDFAKAEVSRKAAEDRRDEAYFEIAAVTRLLRGNEGQMARQQALLDWVMRVAQLLLADSGGVRGLLPASFRRKLIFRRLAAEGLFDANAYLTRYPDVRASGGDPLRHYILHGIAEGRQGWPMGML